MPPAEGAKSKPLTVLSTKSAPPSEDVYEQEIPESGYGYLTTRDGTKLAIYVHPPEDVSNALPTGYVPHVPAGPTPTLIEYSGYGYANPAGPQSGISVIANLMGFTVVDVNMRGTGCSGGAFDFFEPLQNLDGYDIIETVARQPWVKHGKVGMMGISYGGISQLFTAQTQPPSLAAISPLSLIDQVQTTLYPGGILNTGFAFNWAKERAEEARPAGPDAGQEWAYKRIQEGDKTCEENQVMHGEAAKLIDKVRANDTYRPKVADPLSPITFVDKIKVPTFMACQWTDEQTGRPLPDARLALHRDGQEVVHVHERHARRLARAGDVQPLVRLLDAVRREAGADAEPGWQSAPPRRSSTTPRWASTGRRCRPTRSRRSRPTRARSRRSRRSTRSGSCSTTAPAAIPASRTPASSNRSRQLPDPGHARRARGTSAGDGKLAGREAGRRRHGLVHLERHAPSRSRTSDGDTGAGENGLWTASPAYEWEQNPDGDRALVRDRAARREHGGHRRRRRAGVGEVVEADRRPPGRDHRGAAGRQGDLRPERLGPRQDAQARQPPQSTPLTPVLSLRKKHISPMPAGPLREGDDPALLRGPRLPRRLAHPRDHHRPERRPADLGVRRGEAEAEGERHDRLLAAQAVAPDPARWCPGVDVPTELPPCPGLRGEPCRDYVPPADG